MSTGNVVEALVHPLRSEIFDALTGWLGTATVAELAELTESRVEDVVRDIAVLDRCGLVEPVSDGDRDAPIDVSTAFRATRDPAVDDEEWAQFPASLRRKLAARSLENLEEQVWAALARGGFDGADAHVSWVGLELDDRGRAEMAEALAQMLERARVAQSRSAARRAEGATQGEECETDLMLLHFRRGTESDSEPGTGPGAAARERAFGLSEEIAAEVPDGEPDWARIAGRARELAALAERCGRAAKRAKQQQQQQ